jgi:HPr kinase/phosphorylase
MSTHEPGVSVGTVLADGGAASPLALELLAGREGLDRLVTIPYIQKTGLALAGYDAYLRHGRVLIFGESEVRFLQSLVPLVRVDAIRRVLARDIPCVLVTDNLDAGADLTVEAERAGVPLLRTPVRTPAAIAHLTAMLEVHLAPRDVLHGVLLDILGLGVLVAGESGIGKSECALDLIARGHRLIADDAVDVYRRTEGIVIGTCPAPTRHHMEIRGLGIINVRDLFGIASTRSSKRIELVVQLERWETGRQYERLGLDDAVFDILDVSVPMVRMPVAPGRNVAMLVEVAARNQLLRARGRHAARDLAARLDRQLLDDAPPPAADGVDPGEDA